MRSNSALRLPPPVRRSLLTLGRDISVARRKRRLTQQMMAERIGVTPFTYARIEKGDPATGLGVYAMALFVLGLGTPMAELAAQSTDAQAILLDTERLPTRVRPRKEPTAR